MERNISVKVSGITNLTSARYFAARNVDYLGFCIDPESPSYCTTQKLTEIISWVEGPAFVLETNHFISDKFAIDENSTIEYLHVNNMKGVLPASSWKKVFVNVPAELDLTSDLPDDLILVIHSNDKPTELSTTLLEKLENICAQKECYVDFAWTTPSETFDFLQNTNCAGIILHGNDDIQTGLQDFDWMDEFFDLLEK